MVELDEAQQDEPTRPHDQRSLSTVRINKMDTPEVYAHHSGHTGHRWLDLGLGVSAFAVSLISLWVAVQHGAVMERLVAANSFPNATIETTVGNRASPGAMRVSLNVTNTGVGTARIETIEIWDDKKPIQNAAGLLSALKTRSDKNKAAFKLA